MHLNRRSFVSQAGAATLGAFLAPSSFPLRAQKAAIDVAAVDRDRILRAANRCLAEKPVTVTASRSPRSAGGLHDYYSEGDYWWPDPKNPAGPYIRRDGFTNPDNFNAHREAMIRLSLIVPALAAAWKITGQKNYASVAGDHLRAWFVTATTRMNPNLEYSQAIFGVNKGRGIGIIDTVHLVEVARAATVLEPSQALGESDFNAVRSWFAAYLAWMRTSKNGREEMAAKNNHGSCWVLQAAEFARLTRDESVRSEMSERFKTVLIPGQVARGGRLPLELARTKPYSYSIFDMDVLSGIAQSLGTRDGDLFRFTTPDGRSLAEVVAFMEPFLADKSKWPYRHDVEHWDEFPVRQPSLLFAGIALNKPEYLALWKRLNPDPTSQEVIRNFPIRQPVLWV